MTDIFIKSFNRPYYLERCLRSIRKFVMGNYQISILDDGTPQRYLDKIQQDFPEVKIIKSENHQRKNQAIADNLATGKEISGFEIPTSLWKNAVKNGSEYCIMTEDDVWFTQEINVNELSEKAKKQQISLLKLGWLGNYRNDKWLSIKSIDNELASVQPKDLFLSNPFVMDLFFYNKYKFFTIGYQLGIFDNYIKLKYWTLNSILMGFWQKDYWLSVWKNAQGKVDEKQQLRNAAVYYKNHQKNPNFIARLSQEAMKTTFQSSATNSYHKYGVDCDINIFNHIINEAWYNDRFDSLNSFPKDISEDYYTIFLNEANHPKCSVEAWKKWTDKFKEQYRKEGVIID